MWYQDDPSDTKIYQKEVIQLLLDEKLPNDFKEHGTYMHIVGTVMIDDDITCHVVLFPNDDAPSWLFHYSFELVSKKLGKVWQWMHCNAGDVGLRPMFNPHKGIGYDVQARRFLIAFRTRSYVIAHVKKYLDYYVQSMHNTFCEDNSCSCKKKEDLPWCMFG